MKKIINFVLTMALLVFASLSNAAIIKFVFNGTIDRVEAGSYSIGQEVSGFLSYDTETNISSFPTGSSPYTTNFGGAIDSFELDSQKVDNITFNILAQTSYFNSDDNSINFSVAGFDETLGFRENLDLEFFGPNLLNSIYQILVEPNFADMSNATFGYTQQKTGSFDRILQEHFYGNIDSIIVASVPIPASLFLFLTGIVSLIISQKNNFIKKSITIQ